MPAPRNRTDQTKDWLHVSQILYGWFFAGLILLSGCKFGKPDPLQLASDAFYSNDFQIAGDHLRKEIDKDRRGSEDQSRLNLASVYCVQKDFRNTERTLLSVRNSQKRNEQSINRIASEGAALLTDQTATVYRCRNYESGLIAGMLPLLSLTNDQVDVVAYCHQLESFLRNGSKNKTNPSKEKTPTSPPKYTDSEMSAFQHFLLGLIQQQDPLQHQNAIENFHRATTLNPNNSFFANQFRWAQSGKRSPQGTGNLYVISFVNPGPQWQEKTATVPTAAMLIATEILSSQDDVSLPPAVAPVRIPELAPSQSPIRSVHISNQNTQSNSQLVWNIHRSAENEYQETINWVIAKAVATRAVKKAVVHAGKEKLGAGSGSGLSQALDIAGVIWELTEKADLRSWNFMPGQVLINRVTLPVGTHRLEAQTIGSSNQPLQRKPFEVRIREGQDKVLFLLSPNQSSPVVIHGTQ